MAGLLSDIVGMIDRAKQSAKANVGLLVSDPREYMASLNDQARAFNQASNLATQAKLNEMRGLLVTPEQAAAKEYVDRVNQNLAMGFAGSTSPIVRQGNPIQSAVVLIGDKIFTGKTHSDALQRAIYEGVVRKESGKLVFPKDAEINSDLFMTKDGQIIDRLQAYKMFDVGASETAIEKGLMQNKPASSMGVDYYMTEAKKLTK